MMCNTKKSQQDLNIKMGIVLVCNVTTLLFDMGATHDIYRSQLKTGKTEIKYKYDVLKTILDAVKPVCYTLGAIGDNKFLTGGDNSVIATDVSPLYNNSEFLLLHLTKTLVRGIEYWNTE